MRIPSIVPPVVASAALMLTACTSVVPSAASEMPPTDSATSTTVALLEPLPYLDELTSLAQPGRGTGIVRASTILTRVQGKDPHHWGGLYVDGDSLVAITALPRKEARRVIAKAGLADAAIRVRLCDITLADLDQAARKVSRVVEQFGVDGFAVGPQYSGDPEPRIAVGLAADQVELRVALARLQEEMGISIVTYRGGVVSLAATS